MRFLRLLRSLRFLSFLLMLCLALPAAGRARAEGVYGASFQTISATVHSASERTGAPGAALILGSVEAVFYVETVGDAALSSPIVLPHGVDLMQAALALTLFDSGHVRPGDPRLRPAFAGRSNGFSDETERSRRALVSAAERAAGRSWAALFSQRIAGPVGLSETVFVPSPSGLAVTRTTPRDYARLAAVFAGDGLFEGTEIVSPGTLNLTLQPEVAGRRICASWDTSGTCTLIETSAPGLYAFIDRTRDIYGVLSAPGTEEMLDPEGHLIRDFATAITERPAQTTQPAGLTAAARR